VQVLALLDTTISVSQATVSGGVRSQCGEGVHEHCNPVLHHFDTSSFMLQMSSLLLTLASQGIAVSRLSSSRGNACQQLSLMELRTSSPRRSVEGNQPFITGER
jgi:hypothetical protein